MGFITGLISVISSLSSAHRLRKAKKRIALTNEREKNIAEYGAIEARQLFPIGQWVGNALLSGGNIDERNDLVVQYCKQAVSFNNTIIVIHENNSRLAQRIKDEFSYHPTVRFIDDLHPYYEPFCRLSNSDLSSLASTVGEKLSYIDVKGQRALRAIAQLLKYKVGRPYIRMMAICPIGQINRLVQELEDNGTITSLSSKEIRRDFDAGDADSAILFLEKLVSETPFLAGNSQLNNSTSIRETVNANGILVIDFQSAARQGALALIMSEIEKCAISTQKVSVVLDVSTDYNDMLLDCLYKLRLPWMVSCPDVFQLSFGKKDAVKRWLSLSNRAIIFKHSEISSDVIASELGTYEKIDETFSTAMDNSIGRFGFHHGDNTGLATKITREQRVFPENIRGLEAREFYLLDNNYSAICKGVLI